jgi:hypothetical protein
MEIPSHNRFSAANQDLRDLLRRAARFANGNGTATERDVATLAVRLVCLAPEIGDASRGETLDAQLRNEIAEYVTNFRALQRAVEKVRDVMMASRVQLETETRDFERLLG